MLTSVIKTVSDNFHTVVDNVFETVAGTGAIVLPSSLTGNVSLFQQVVILDGVVLTLDKLQPRPDIFLFAASQPSTATGQEPQYQGRQGLLCKDHHRLKDTLCQVTDEKSPCAIKILFSLLLF